MLGDCCRPALRLGAFSPGWASVLTSAKRNPTACLPDLQGSSEALGTRQHVTLKRGGANS